MLKNHISMAWRSFRKGRMISIINLTGLMLGIAFTLMIMLWVDDEMKVDKFHQHSSQIYNIYEREFTDGTISVDYSTPGLLAEELKKNIPEVEYATVYDEKRRTVFQAGEKKIKYSGLSASEDFLKIFSYPLLSGNIDRALSDPESIVISEKIAEDLFGSTENAFGKTIRLSDRDDFQVTGILASVPAASSVPFDFLLNWHFHLQQNQWLRDFGNTAPYTTIMLRENADVAQFNKKINRFLDKYEAGQGPGYRIELDMQKYDEHYLYSNFKNGYISGGRIEYVRLFSIVAAFIMFIACINFMNLSTARALKRAREIGVRKIVGAGRRMLIGQFITEALMLSFFSVIASLLLVFISLPAFNMVTGKAMTMPWNELSFWVKLTGIILVSGVLAGLYPAWYISSFDPVKAIKGRLKFGLHALVFRKGLIVFQFTLSIILILATIVVGKQVNFIQTKNIGYDRENLVLVPLEGELLKRYPTFKKQVLVSGDILSMSRLTSPITDIDTYTNSVFWEGKDPSAKPPFAQLAVGYDFIRSIDGELLAGRDFSRDLASDKKGLIINEAALKKIGFKDPINSPLKFADMEGKVIGVVKDFHLRSMHEPIKPLVIYLEEEGYYGYAIVRIAKGKTQEAMAHIRQACSDLNPNFPFTYQFADEEFMKLYTTEIATGALSKYFSALAIFISCMGLLGLVVFNAEQRTREIGIRKVLGAGVRSIVTLLSKDFVILVSLSIVIATPIAWWTGNSWLRSFEYRISLQWWMFALASLIALAIALLTVGAQAVKAALADPVKNLRTE